MRRLVVCIVFAVVVAFLGPRLTGPRSRTAGTPFVYEPPQGFVEAQSPVGAEVGEGVKIWTFGDVGKTNFDGSPVDGTAGLTRIVLHHSDKEMSVEEADLAKLAEEMPKAFEQSCDWVHRRHELRTRSDGARVGMIEGDCDHDIDLRTLGMPAQKIRSRKLQLMFPDDHGTSIVTASYPTEQASRWEPLFEATIGKARGVATRAPAPAGLSYLAWAFAGAVLGSLASALVERTRRT